MTSAWIVGNGGLLGSALSRSFEGASTAVYQPRTRLVWSDADALPAHFATGVREFSERLSPSSGWEIYWAAGIGNMGSAPSQFDNESRALQVLLDEVARNERLRACPGAVVYCSSAGALYAGSTDRFVTESSPVAPTTPYAFAKLAQEDLLRDFSRAQPAHRVLIARISTVFGPRGPARESKGLFAHLARSMLRHTPVRIFVPLDTMRDYVYSDDAARSIVATLRTSSGAEALRIKIVASQRFTTIAEILAHFARVARRQPRIITGATALTSQYSGRVSFRSEVGPDTAGEYRSAMPVCVARILESERVVYAAGSKA